MIGEPQVTSSLLVDSLARELEAGYSGCGITCCPLEADGAIQQRVETHLEQILANEKVMRLLLDHRPLVVFAAHSQGVPTSAFIAKELIEQGVLRPENLRIFGLTGILEGPYRQIRYHPFVKYVEGYPAKQLFHFGKPDKQVKIDFDSTVAEFLHSGAKLVLLASWMDQVVPISSAILSSFAPHPNLMRGLFVPEVLQDEEAPVVRLLEICIYMLGHPVYHESGARVLQALSPQLVPSLYVGQGHSTIALAQDSFKFKLPELVAGSKVHVRSSRLASLDLVANTYLVPWHLSILKDCSDPFIARKVAELLPMIAAWKPVRQPWMALKEQMEPLLTIRSRL